jgi:DNA-directed RNA polymerase subunit RPC12/RpoP
MSELEEEGITYKCWRCGSKVSSRELDFRGGEIKCIICGYRVLKKTRSLIVRRVKAE